MGDKIKKLTLVLLLFIVVFLAFSFPAKALEIQLPPIPGVPLPQDPTLPEYIRYLYSFSIILSGLVAFVSLIYGGFRYLISGGNAASMADARDQITAGFTGLIILLGAYILLGIINPQLTLLRFDPPDLPDLPSIVTTDELNKNVYRFYEIPIGQLIENALDQDRLDEIADAADAIVRESEDLADRAADLWPAVAICNDCSATNPNIFLICQGSVCPNIADVNVIEADLVSLAGDLAQERGPMLSPYTSLDRDKQRLYIGKALMDTALYPLNYDDFLEIKQTIMGIGGEVKIVPFVILGTRVPGLGDPATFYVDEDRVWELVRSGDLPEIPPFNTLAECNECEIDLHATNFDIPESIKQAKINSPVNVGGGITAPCPGGLDCWDYVIQWGKNNGWNPAFLLAMWEEEGGYDPDGFCEWLPSPAQCWVMGCLAGTGDIVQQLGCFTATAGPGGNCQPGVCVGGNNTDFCALMRCWSGGPNSCLLLGVGDENPDFWTNYFDAYMSLIPTPGEGQEDPAAPSGNCTTTSPDILPPGLAGCPLNSTNTEFAFNGGWHNYCMTPDPLTGQPFTICSTGSPCPVGDVYIHDAVDLNAINGRPIYAVVPGTASAQGSDADGCGIQVHLRDGFGGLFVYCHLQDTANIPQAPDWAPVGIGELIGHSDDTGFTRGAHLHFAYYPSGVMSSSNASPVECLDIECIPITNALNYCTDEANACP